MFSRLVRHPVAYTFVGTACTTTISYGVTHFTLAEAGMSLPMVALYLVIGLPVVVTPLTIYPLLALLKRQRLMRLDLEHLLRTDVLTDLPNRRAFFEFAQMALPARFSPSAPLTAMMIDVDNFKRINDSYGHDVGDAVLKRVAGVIRDEVAGAASPLWTAARIGGEEFAVIADGLTPSAVARLADRICAQVHRWVGAGDNMEPGTVSVGVAFRTQGEGIDRLLKAADDAVYASKRNGRDRWTFAGDLRGEPAARRAPVKPLPAAANDRLATG